MAETTITKPTTGKVLAQQLILGQKVQKHFEGDRVEFNVPQHITGHLAVILTKQTYNN